MVDGGDDEVSEGVAPTMTLYNEKKCWLQSFGEISFFGGCPEFRVEKSGRLWLSDSETCSLQLRRKIPCYVRAAS